MAFKIVIGRGSEPSGHFLSTRFVIACANRVRCNLVGMIIWQLKVCCIVGKDVLLPIFLSRFKLVVFRLMLHRF